MAFQPPFLTGSRRRVPPKRSYRQRAPWWQRSTLQGQTKVKSLEDRWLTFDVVGHDYHAGGGKREGDCWGGGVGQKDGLERRE